MSLLPDLGQPSHAPRLFLHPDGQALSIGFEDTPDTLLFLHHGDNWRDAARLSEWVDAVTTALSRPGPPS